MKTSLHFFARASHRAGFTRIELVVVVLVAAMLTGLGTSVIRGTKNQVKIAQCAGNLRQFALSQLLYAGDYSDMLPAPANSGSYWAWDLEWNIGNMLNQYGTPPIAMYCPGTAPRFQPKNNMELYQYAPNSTHVIGYAMALPGNLYTVPRTNVNFTTTPQPIQLNSVILPPPPASQRVLSADANLTSFSGSGNYYSIIGGYTSDGHFVPHICPHLDGFIPAGGNLAMLDGHVEWRPFSQMRVRTLDSVNGVQAPVFYW